MEIVDKVQKEMELAEQAAVQILCKKANLVPAQISIRSLRPTDIKIFTAGTSGTSKTMGENDLTVAAGTTENTLSTDITTSEAMVIEGLYLPAVTGITTSYVSMFIGDSKQRWYRGASVTAEPNSKLYFDDPLVIKPGDEIKIRFLTSGASPTHPIEILGKMLKAQA